VELSQKISVARKEKGLTQELLAEKAKVSLSTVKRIEKGKVTPRIHTLKNLSEILEINLLTPPANPSTSDVKNTDNLLIVFTSIVLLFVPPLNILYLLKLWANKKGGAFFESTGKKLLTFQMSSFILFFLLLFAVLSITFVITGQKVYGQVNSPLILYITFITVNISAVIFILNTERNEEMALE